MNSLVFALHFAATWYLVGLCWLVQRVQYPLMEHVGSATFERYEQAHVSQITPVVGPMMIVELATGLWLLLRGGDTFLRPSFAIAFALVVVIWISTFGVQVPLHTTLGQGFDAQSHASLVRTNWIRTIAWTLRGLLLLGILIQQDAFAGEVR
jgi:hypothetical protein